MLLLDEPTAHLDPARKRELADLLREFAAEGRTILLTTHDPEFAAACADRVALLSAGEVFAHGTPAGVLTSRNLERAFGVSMTVSQIAGRTVVLW
jgi:iron complex transport system ATP-binding protein